MLLSHKITGEGVPVILIHGLFGAKENLGMITRALQQDFQVVAVDLRNHGRSFHAPEASHSLMAQDVFHLMDHLGLDNSHIIGHSLGGKVAMQMALTEANRINRLIPVDIAPRAYPPHHNDILTGLKQLNQTVLTSRQQADQLLAAYEPDQATRQFLLTNIQRQEDKTLGLRLNIEGIADNQHALAATVSGTPFNGPTLFIGGGNSDYINADSHTEMERLFPNHKLATIEGAGHMVHAEKTAEFNQLVMTFLAQS